MAKKLTDQETKELKEKALLALSGIRRELLISYPFLGAIALRLDIVPVRDARLPTAATDGDKIYFDIAFLSGLSEKERVFVFAHEVWHAALMHLERKGERDINLFNIATDMEVNNMLVNDGLTAPKWVIMPDKQCKDKCAEEIYDILLKRQNKNQQQKQPGNKIQDQGSDKNDNNDNGNEGQFDKHIYSGEEGEEQPKDFKPIEDKYGEVGLDPDFKPKVSKEYVEKMREAVVTEAQRIARQRGEMPSGIASLVKEMCQPEIKWQEQLAKFVTKTYKNAEYRWTPPNRRHVYNNVYMQSRYAQGIRVACIVDTSGSTTNDRSKFLSELHGLINSFGTFELHLICCDAEVQKYELITNDDDVNFETDGYEFSGGGGTSMLPAFEYINDNSIDVDAVIILTDGYIDIINQNPTNFPVLWVITKNGSENDIKFGEIVKFKN